MIYWCDLLFMLLFGTAFITTTTAVNVDIIAVAGTILCGWVLWAVGNDVGVAW